MQSGPDTVRQCANGVVMRHVATISKSLREADGIYEEGVRSRGNLMQLGGEFLFEEAG